LTKDGKRYGPQRYKQLIQQCYIISKNCNTPYTDIRDKLTPTEKNELLRLIKEEDDRNKEHLKQMKESRQAKRNNRR
jgi:hypothetical protein